MSEILSDVGVDVSTIFMAYCPERVLPGKIMMELVENDRVVGGLTPEATQQVSSFYRTFVRGAVLETEAKTAEMCKLTENSFRDVNISFANELSMICAKDGINVWNLIQLASKLGAASLPAGKVRIFIQGAGANAESATAFLGEDWGKFTPIDDEMRLYLGVAQDIVVQRTIERRDQTRVAGNLYNREIIIKYEVENFKPQPVTLDVAESISFVRNEIFGDNGREIQWELGPQTTFQGGPDAEKSSIDKVLFHAPLPAKSADGKAIKTILKLHLILKNEW